MKNLTLGVINNEELIDIFGSEKNKENFYKTKKVPGSMKQNILDKAKRYCDIVDLGEGEYEIKEIYNEPKPASLSKLQKGVYQYLAPVILLKLIEEHDKNNKIVLPLMDYARHIEMINQNYKPIKYNQKQSSEILNIDREVISDFFEKVDDNIKYYIQRSLEYLKKCDVLKWYKVPMVKKIKTIIDQDNNTIIECNYQDVRATSEEVKLFNDISEEVRDELGIKKQSECFYGNKASKFLKKVTERLKGYGILYFYDSYEIYYTNLDRTKRLLNEFQFTSEEDLIKEFNNYFISLIVNNAEKRQLKKIKDDLLDVGDYVINIKTLSEWTIDKDKKRLELKNIDKKMLEKMEDDLSLKVVKRHRGSEIEKQI